MEPYGPPATWNPMADPWTDHPDGHPPALTTRDRLAGWRAELHYQREKARDRTWLWLAWHLPRDLVGWCVVRVVAETTTGRWDGTVVPELTAAEALKRWTREDDG